MQEEKIVTAPRVDNKDKDMYINKVLPSKRTLDLIYCNVPLDFRTQQLLTYNVNFYFLRWLIIFLLLIVIYQGQ